MRVGADLDRYAKLLRGAAETPVEVEAMRVGVQLDRHAHLRRLLEHGVHVYRVRLAREEEPARRVAEDGEVRIVHRAEHAVGHRTLVEPEARVDGADHVVEARERLVVVVHAAIGQDVGLDPLEHPEAIELLVHPVDLRVLLEHALGREAAGVEGGLRVVGDSEVAPPAGLGGRGHLGDGRFAVRVLRMAVEHAPDVRGGDQRGERAARPRLDLAAPLAQLGLDVGKAERRVERELVGDRDGGIARRAQLVLHDSKATLGGPRAQGRHVVRAAGRAPERNAELRGRHAMKIELRAIHEADAHRASAGARHLAHARCASERGGDFRRGGTARGDDINVAHDLAAPAHRSGDGGALHVRVRLDRRAQADRFSQRAVREHIVARLAKEGDSLEDALRGLGPEALE